MYFPSLLILPLHFGTDLIIFFLLISNILPLSDPIIPTHWALFGIGTIEIISLNKKVFSVIMQIL